MKTIIIYDQCDAAITFFVVDGDKRYLDKVYVNQCEENEVKEGELLDIVESMEPLTAFPEGDIGPDTYIIVAGFLP